MKYKAEDWETVALSEICDLIPGFAFKSKDFGDYKSKVIKIANITPPTVNMANLAGVDIKQYDSSKLEKYIAQQGDFVLAMTGATIGKIGRIEYGQAYINQRVLLFRPKEIIDQDYLYYVLQQHKFLQYVVNHVDSESAQPNISAGTVGKYQIYLPPMDLQKKIGRVLRTYDELIELNRKINDNLLEQMQALYKSWFVDYLPFGGEIPTSWTQTGIYSLANIIYGAPFASKQFNTEGNGKPIIRIRDLKDQQFATYTTEVHPKGYLLQPGDIVVGMDGEFRPYIWGNDEAWLNQRVCVFENKRPNGKAFLYFTIKPLLFAIEQTQAATTVIHIGKKDFDAFEIMLPDTELLDAFDVITTPMVEQIVSNSIENKRLAIMRDALLPKLISGEIDVSNLQL